MAAHPNPFPILNSSPKEQRSVGVLRNDASNEYVFAVVGHVGSGTSAIAKELHALISERKLADTFFQVNSLKASGVIGEWAIENGLAVPASGTAKPKLSKDVETMQDYGDRMRSEATKDGYADHAAVARRLIRRIQQKRSECIGAEYQEGEVVQPDGKPRAFVLDSIRHPDEVHLLRTLYGDAFILIGVVCEEERRIQRITTKYSDAGKDRARELMRRDANAKEKWGQHVEDAFHLADFFVDNTANRVDGKHWSLPEGLSRLLKIITHSELVRPTIAETAMFHAFSAKMQSACLSKQVGAAVMDAAGNLVAAGTNEAPRAGGGVYGESFDEGDKDDHRCAYFHEPKDRFCRNTREQFVIIEDLIEKIPQLNQIVGEDREALRVALQKTRIGGLIEFSRAVHAEMDALFSAARQGVSLSGCRLFVTTFPCHYCARHIVTAGIDEVQYIEAYPKSRATGLHQDSITTEFSGWKPPSQGGRQVLFRPFTGVAPGFYRRAFFKDRDLKDKRTGNIVDMTKVLEPEWTGPWYLPRAGYVEIEATLSKTASPDAPINQDARPDSGADSPPSNG